MKFKLGQTVITANAQNVLGIEESALAMVWMHSRHAKGDWGDLDNEDKALNDRGLNPQDPGRLFSAYNMPSGKKVWIITEWDRSVTTILLPEDY
jgi:hypothetical protein